MFRILIVLSIAATLGGCAAIQSIVGDYGGEQGLALLEKAADGVEKVEDTTLGNAAKALPKYCTVPGKARQLFRNRVNDRPEAEGAEVGIWCPGDDALTLGQ